MQEEADTRTRERIGRRLLGMIKKMFGYGMNVEAEKAATAHVYWLDINLPESDSHEEEVEGFISEIVGKVKN